MIFIQQDKSKLKQIENLFEINDYMANFEIDEKLIKEDIRKLKNRSDTASNKNNIKNLKYIIDKLENILDKVEDGKLEHTFSIDRYGDGDGYELTQYGVETDNYYDYDIYFRDYIKAKDDEKVVSIEYRELADALALELMYRDIGETHDTIEKKLDGYGIVGIYDIKDLFRELKTKNKLYELSSKKIINSSPYIRADGKSVTDYFNIIDVIIDKYGRTRYRKVVEFSVRHAILISLLELQERLNKEQIQFKVSTITEFGIDLVVNDRTDKNINKIIDVTMVVRVFGRKFEIKPRVQIY